MDDRVGRRFTLMDAMILVGLTGLGLTRLPSAWPEAWEVFRRFDVGHFRQDAFPGRNFEAWPQTGRMDSMSLMVRKLFAPILDRNPPGPSFRKPDGSRSTRQEWLENFGLARTNSNAGGRAAGYAAAGEAYVLAFPFLLFWTIGLMLIRLRRPRPGPAQLWRQPGWWACVAAWVGVVVGLAWEAVVEWDAYTIIVPGAVLLSWLTLLLTRSWSAEASWIDRAGRGLGLGWIGLIPLYVVGFALPYFH